MPDPNRPFDVAAPQAPGDAAPGSDTEQSPSQADTSSAQVVPVKDDQDSPWKDALELFFRQAIELLAPTLHAEIDWSVAPDFLDKELQAIAIPGKQGRRFVDKLVRVRLLAGTDAWLLIHVEVERRLRGRQALRLFSWRMYEYRHRIQVRLMRQRRLDLPPHVYSLGILLDNRGVDGHLTHTDEHRGQGVRFTFPAVELEGWRDRWDELESLASGNPFAVVIMAQLQANRYRDKRTRLGPKFELVRALRHYGYEPEVAGQVYRLIEWMIALPEDLEPDYQRAITALSEESRMTYVTLIEREGIKRGRLEGIAEGRVEGIAEGRVEGIAEGRVEGQADLLLRQIQRRFGRVDAETAQRIRAARSKDLETWSLSILDAATLEDVFRA